MAGSGAEILSVFGVHFLCVSCRFMGPISLLARFCFLHILNPFAYIFFFSAKQRADKIFNNAFYFNFALSFVSEFQVCITNKYEKYEENGFFYIVYLIFSQYFIISLYLTSFLCAQLKCLTFSVKSRLWRDAACRVFENCNDNFFYIFFLKRSVIITYFMNFLQSMKFWLVFNWHNAKNMKKVLHFSPITKIIRNK